MILLQEMLYISYQYSKMKDMNKTINYSTIPQS